MKKLLVVLVAATALVLTGAAAAKGPSEAKIAGPGLAAPLTIGGVGEGDTSTPLGLLVAETGFFPEVFGQSPSPLLRAKPGDLGPRYVVTYTVPGPSTDMLEQELYPYADDGPTSYMRAGQKFWGNQRTLGGWYRGASQLTEMLVRAGLPSAAPPERDLIASVLRAILRHLL
ncbi:MAG: hypothetical protein ACJ74L_12040 [Gaiellaceae bacterium]